MTGGAQVSRQPIRVAFLAPSLHAGGAERQMLILAGMLPRPTFELRFLLLSERGELASEAEALGVQVHVLGLDRDACSGNGFNPRCAIAVARSIRSYRRLTRGVDIVDAWLFPAFTFAGLAQPFARVPVLLAGRRQTMGSFRTRTWFRNLGASLAMRQMRAVVANSHIAADQAVKSEKIPPGRVHVIQNAVVPLPRDAMMRFEMRQKWRFSAEHVVVGCVANFRQGKGHDLLLDAAEQLRERCPALRWVFVGNGPLGGLLERQIEDRKLGSHVVIHSGERDARHVYGAFDVAVQASASEGLPNAVLEAAAAALPIVATDVGGTREILTPGEDGILVQRGDRDGLVEAIARLAGDPALRLRLGLAAEKRSQHFSPARLTRETADLYLQLAERRINVSQGPGGWFRRRL